MPLLQAFLDGALDEPDAGRVDRHLEACRRCGLEAEVYREIKDALRRRRYDPASEAIDRLRAFVGQVTGQEAEPEETSD